MTIVSELFKDWNGGLTRLKTLHYELKAHVARVGGTTGAEATQLTNMGIDIALVTREGIAYLKVLSGRFISTEPWDKDITDELATNDNCPGSLKNGWWQRELSQITGLTFHHTLSDSPHATASYYVKKAGGRPSLPYTIWCTQTGEILLCNRLEEGCWHNHQGHKNKQLSVGLAGSLHVHRPAKVQLDAAARIAVWAIHHPEMNVVLETVKGHCDYIATQCPGWASEASGHWKSELYQLIEELL